MTNVASYGDIIARIVKIGDYISIIVAVDAFGAVCEK